MTTTVLLSSTVKPNKLAWRSVSSFPGRDSVTRVAPWDTAESLGHSLSTGPESSVPKTVPISVERRVVLHTLDMCQKPTLPFDAPACFGALKHVEKKSVSFATLPELCRPDPAPRKVQRRARSMGSRSPPEPLVFHDHVDFAS
jgi:hypothetical protein